MFSSRQAKAAGRDDPLETRYHGLSMAGLKIQEDFASVVLVGSFNPAIFQPAWLASKQLIREAEAEAATIEVIHPEVTQFVAAWLQMSVTHERFAASTSDPAHRAPLRDLVAGIFELLEHTPTRALGLNRSMHVDAGNGAAWHALGDLIAPKEPWQGILERPGMQSLMMKGARPDGAPGSIQFRVEPSIKYPMSVFLEVNSEYRAMPDRTTDATAYFVDRLRQDWERTLRDAHEGVEKLMRQIVQEKA